MKEAIGGTWLFGLTITFIALFTTFVSVTTNYSRCYKIKDEIISTIERKHGVNDVIPATGSEPQKDGSIRVINRYLNSIGYRSKGKCPSDGNCWLGFRVNSDQPVSGYNDTVNYCIAKQAVVYEVAQYNEDGSIVDTTILNGALGHPRHSYYQVVVFFKIEWPILNKIFDIHIDGETSVVYLNYDIKEFDNCYN